MDELNENPREPGKARFLPGFLSTLFSLTATVLLCVVLLPYPLIKGMADRLAPDGNLRLFTLEFVSFWRYPLLVVAVLFLFGAFALFMRPKDSQEFFSWAYSRTIGFFLLLFTDAGTLLNDFRKSRPARFDMYFLAVVVAFGTVLRVLLINRPIEFDEAYTFIEFARYSFRQILTDYSVPNNHIFHTILVRIAYLILGDNPWQLRIPSFLASLVLIICIYFLGRNMYDRKVGLLSAVLVAATPIIVFRSVAARGYIILSLMVVLAFLAGDYVSRKRNLFGWFLLGCLSALGFYTIPVMLYPYGLILVWLSLMVFRKDVLTEYASAGNWFKHIGFSALSTMILTLLFYAPVLLSNNFLLIYKKNTVLQPTELGAFLGSVPGLAGQISAEWTAGISGLLLVILVIGLFLPVFVARPLSKSPVILEAIFVIYIVTVVLILRPDPLTRIWVWVTPLLALWSSVGLVAGTSWLAQKFPFPDFPEYPLAVLLLLIAINGSFGVYSAMVTQSIVEDPAAEKVTQALRSQITEHDIVLVSDCTSPRYWYYFSLYGLPEDAIRFVKNRPFDRALVITYTGADAQGCKTESVQDVIHKESPVAGLLDPNTLRVLTQVDYVTVYEVNPYPGMIKALFPQP